MNHITQLCSCGKTYCINEQDAQRIVKRIQKRKGCSNSVRYYSCRFGGWHWTQSLERRSA